MIAIFLSLLYYKDNLYVFVSLIPFPYSVASPLLSKSAPTGGSCFLPPRREPGFLPLSATQPAPPRRLRRRDHRDPHDQPEKSRSAYAPHAGDDPILRDDKRGVPRSLRLLAALIEVGSRRYAAAASRSAESELVCAFHDGLGATFGATLSVSIGEFLERTHRFIQLGGCSACDPDPGHMLRSRRDLPGPVLPQPRRAGVGDLGGAVHRLVSVALFVGAKFGADNTLPKRSTAVFETSSDCAICSGLRDLQEMIPEQQDRLKKRKSEHGKVQLGNITVNMVLGGMRGMTTMLWETSLLDPEEVFLCSSTGIRFRVLSIPECQKVLPTTVKDGDSFGFF